MLEILSIHKRERTAKHAHSKYTDNVYEHYVVEKHQLHS